MLALKAKEGASGQLMLKEHSLLTGKGRTVYPWGLREHGPVDTFILAQGNWLWTPTIALKRITLVLLYQAANFAVICYSNCCYESTHQRTTIHQRRWSLGKWWPCTAVVSHVLIYCHKHRSHKHSVCEFGPSIESQNSKAATSASLFCFFTSLIWEWG